MRWLHVDTAGGIAGDMLVAALLDAGGDARMARRIARALGLRLALREERRASLRGLRASLDAANPGQPVKHYGDGVLARLAALPLSDKAMAKARCALQALLAAEAAVHGAAAEHVHLHEAGDDDAIFDVACSLELMRRLGVEGVSVTPLPMGSGHVACAHGALPLPAPATLELVKGFRLCAAPPGEWVTPTGAAILSAMGPKPDLPFGFRLQRVGTGIGSRDEPARANVLRVWLGEVDVLDAADEEIVELTTDVDDMTAEQLADAHTRLLQAGACDVSLLALTMKKGRPGTRLSVLARPEDEGRLLHAIFDSTTTLGVRRARLRRHVLARCGCVHETPFGRVRFKKAAGKAAKPEYEDCRDLAGALGMPLVDLQRRLMSWHEAHGDCVSSR